MVTSKMVNAASQSMRDGPGVYLDFADVRAAVEAAEAAREVPAMPSAESLEQQYRDVFNADDGTPLVPRMARWIHGLLLSQRQPRMHSEACDEHLLQIERTSSRWEAECKTHRDSLYSVAEALGMSVSRDDDGEVQMPCGSDVVAELKERLKDQKIITRDHAKRVAEIYVSRRQETDEGWVESMKNALRVTFGEVAPSAPAQQFEVTEEEWEQATEVARRLEKDGGSFSWSDVLTDLRAELAKRAPAQTGVELTKEHAALVYAEWYRGQKAWDGGCTAEEALHRAMRAVLGSLCPSAPADDDCDHDPKHHGRLVHRQYHDQAVERLTTERDTALRELAEARKQLALVGAQLLAVGSVLSGDDKGEDNGHPRWTPTLEDAGRVRKELLVARERCEALEAKLAAELAYSRAVEIDRLTADLAEARASAAEWERKCRSARTAEADERSEKLAAQEQSEECAAKVAATQARLTALREAADSAFEALDVVTVYSGKAVLLEAIGAAHESLRRSLSETAEPAAEPNTLGPARLVGALQDRIHHESGATRVAKSVKVAAAPDEAEPKLLAFQPYRIKCQYCGAYLDDGCIHERKRRESADPQARERPFNPLGDLQQLRAGLIALVHHLYAGSDNSKIADAIAAAAGITLQEGAAYAITALDADAAAEGSGKGGERG